MWSFALFSHVSADSQEVPDLDQLSQTTTPMPSHIDDALINQQEVMFQEHVRQVMNENEEKLSKRYLGSDSDKSNKKKNKKA